MSPDSGQMERKEIRIKGKPVTVNSIQIDGIPIIITGKTIKIARRKEEWLEDIEDPTSILKQLKKSRAKADIFTFWQRLPETKPKFAYYMEWDNVAALHITNYEQWWEKQLNAKTRNMIRRAEKKGIEVKVVEFDDQLIKGITGIFDETPIRQGKPFWHYRKDFQTVKREMSDRLDIADFIGAYYDNELVGFIKLLHAGRYLDMVEILSKIGHRDKAPTNALLAKAVEICDKKKLEYIVYAHWPRGSLGDFKRHNGFEKIDLPRYYVPLTIKGTAFLKLHLHHGIVGILPENWKVRLIDLRRRWYSRKPASEDS